MSAKHTPGPWMLSRGAQGDAFSVEAVTKTVAHVKLAREADANARLIVAAPELREALAVFVRGCIVGLIGTESRVARDHVMVCRALLARIDGEQS